MSSQVHPKIRTSLDPVSSVEPLIGFETNGIRFERRIGHGAMGVVYQGVQIHLQRPVAIKVIAALHASDHRYVERFSREAQAVARLLHPSIVACYHFGPCTGPDGQPLYLLAMEYVDGPSLTRWLQEPRLVRDVLMVYADICDALAVAHGADILHRDIKPDNIMVTSERRGKLTDFGLARGFGSANEAAAHVTQAGELIGSPAYMSPEACRGEALGCSSDLYSLGCSLIQSLTGQLPFPAQAVLQTLQCHLTQPAPDLATIRPDLKVCGPLISHCLAKDPKRRPASASALAIDLRNLALRLPTGCTCGGASGVVAPTVVDTMRPDSMPTARRRGPWIRQSLVGAAVIGIGLATAVMFHRNPPSKFQGSPAALPTTAADVSHVQEPGKEPYRHAATVPVVAPLVSAPSTIDVSEASERSARAGDPPIASPPDLPSAIGTSPPPGVTSDPEPISSPPETARVPDAPMPPATRTDTADHAASMSPVETGGATPEEHVSSAGPPSGVTPSAASPTEIEPARPGLQASPRADQPPSTEETASSTTVPTSSSHPETPHVHADRTNPTSLHHRPGTLRHDD